MKFWKSDEGNEFKSNENIFGREYQPDSKKVDIARISVRGEFPSEGAWGRVGGGSCEIVTVVKGEGYAEFKDHGKVNLTEGDVLYVEHDEWFRWGGNMDIVAACSPAFDSTKREEMKER